MDHVFSWRGTPVIYRVPCVEYIHVWNSRAWNMCGNKRAINTRNLPAINLQKRVEFSPQL